MDTVFLIIAKILIGALAVSFASAIWSFSNAIGELIAGKCLGYEFISFSWLICALKRENSKLVIKPINFQWLAECGMVKAKSKGNERLWRGVVGSLISGILLGIPGYAILTNRISMGPLRGTEMEGIVETWLLIGVAFFWLCCFILSIREIFLTFSKNEKGILIKKNKEVMEKLHAGFRPGNIDMPNLQKKEKPNANELRYDLFTYYHYLDKGELKSVGYYVDIFERNFPNQNSQFMLPYFYEAVFYHTFIERNLIAAENIMGMVGEELEVDKDANGRRVYAYYLFFTGKDKKAAMQVLKEGLQAIDTFKPKGLASLERDLLYQLKEIMEG